MEVARYRKSDDATTWAHAAERYRALVDALDGRSLDPGLEADLGSGAAGPPRDDLADPLDLLAAEEQAERAAGIAAMAADPEHAEAWFRRAIVLYDRVADGLTRKDDLLEQAALRWRGHLVELVGRDELDADAVSNAARRTLQLLLDAEEVNTALGDRFRVGELKSIALDVVRGLVDLDGSLVGQLERRLGEAFEHALRLGDLEGAVATLAAVLDDIDGLEDDDDAAQRIETYERWLRASWARLCVETDRRDEPWVLHGLDERVEARGLSGR